MAAGDHFKFRARFWMGRTGKQIRSLGLEAQVLAIYLFTCPSANSIGLYYLPLTVACAETGLIPLTIDRVLSQLQEIGFVSYDRDTEEVWVPSMARIQLGDTLHPQDGKCEWLRKELEKLADHAFVSAFRNRYAEAYHLNEHPAKKTPAVRAVRAVGAPTWLTPFNEIWKARYEGDMPFEKVAPIFKKLVDNFGTEEVQQRFQRYVAKTDGTFVSVPRFAQTIGQWAKPTSEERPFVC